MAASRESQESEVHAQLTGMQVRRSTEDGPRLIVKDGKGKNFQQRVDEFSMWKDEGTFQEMEYKRRRDEKKKMKGTIRSDRRLIWSSRSYYPIIGLISISSLSLLLSSLEGLGEDTFFWDHKPTFQILGGVFLTVGIIALMGVAAYTYRREDTVRASHGYPSLFTSSLKGDTSTKNMEEVMMVHNTFIDQPRRYRERGMSRIDSFDSKDAVVNGNNALTQSFSSTSTAMSWVHKHRRYTTGLSRQSSIRRENSDSALDKIFARNQLYSCQTDRSARSPTTSDADGGDYSTDNSGRTPDSIHVEETMPTDRKELNNKNGEASKIESCVSMASSGYCSNISTQCLSHSYNNNNDNKNQRQPPLCRHLSEPSRKLTVHYAAKRSRMLSVGIIPDEDTFQEQPHSVVPNIPVINIECV